MDALIPSLLDPGMAPPGKPVMSIFVQYASSELEGGWNEEKKAQFLDVVIDTLAQYQGCVQMRAEERSCLLEHSAVPAPIDATPGE